MNTTPPESAAPDNSSTVSAEASAAPANLPVLAVRGGVGGVLMGLANLVPGISGGTMLLAAGVYPRFIAAIGELTTLKFRKASIVVLGSVIVAALAAIVLLAGPVKELVVNQRWVMYSLFIGLTLGGVPVVWRLITADGRKADASVWIAAVIGFIAMAALAVYQSAGGGSDVERTGFVFMLLAGVAGASAMILPGVSGGYLLLVLGVYVPILAGVDAFKDGLKAQDMEVLTTVGLAVVLPVGLGVVLGVVGVSNLLKWLLERFEKATLGVLLGLLLGAVVGLWPFQQSISPTPELVVKGQKITQVELSPTDLGYAAKSGVYLEDYAVEVRNGSKWLWVYVDSEEGVEVEDLPTDYFKPSASQIGGAAGLIVLGLAVTLLVDRFGREKPERSGGRSGS